MSTVTSPSETVTGETRRGLIDCDVHPAFTNGLADIVPYMTPSWRQRMGHGVTKAGSYGASQVTLPINGFYVNVSGVTRGDATPPGGGVAGGDPAFTVEQLLDPYDISRALLIGNHVLGVGAYPDADLQVSIASAYNDWMQERWLEYDKRFRGALLVGPKDPARAAREIDRVAGRPGIMAVLLPLFNLGMGERHYHPIYEAAQRHGLPIVVHPGGVEGIFAQAPNYPVTPSYYIEYRMLLSQIHQANVTSLIAHGTFEEFPKLKVVIVEGGFMWVSELMYKFDREWLGLRDEIPWVKRPPSEYIREHVRFTTQPLPEPHKKEYLAQILDMVYASETLLFSSDYPHWDFDDPRRALANVSEELKQRIFVDTATELFGDRLK